MKWAKLEVDTGRAKLSTILQFPVVFFFFSSLGAGVFGGKEKRDKTAGEGSCRDIPKAARGQREGAWGMVKTFVVRHRGEMRDSMGMEGKGTVCRENREKNVGRRIGMVKLKREMIMIF